MIMMIIITVIITIIKINQRAWVKPSGDEVQADKSESSSKAVQKQRPVPYTEAALVREFKEHTSIKSHQFLVKEAQCYANEMRISFEQPVCKDINGKDISCERNELKVSGKVKKKWVK